MLHTKLHMNRTILQFPNWSWYTCQKKIILKEHPRNTKHTRRSSKPFPVLGSDLRPCSSVLTYRSLPAYIFTALHMAYPCPTTCGGSQESKRSIISNCNFMICVFLDIYFYIFSKNKLTWVSFNFYPYFTYVCHSTKTAPQMPLRSDSKPQNTCDSEIARDSARWGVEKQHKWNISMSMEWNLVPFIAGR